MTKILLIEDNAMIRYAVSSLLNLRCFNVVEAENGVIGLQLAKKNLPELVICDINMPKIDGYEVLQKLRSNLRNVKTSFIFYTSETTPNNRRKAMQLGVNNCLAKSGNFDKLLESFNY